MSVSSTASVVVSCTIPILATRVRFPGGALFLTSIVLFYKYIISCDIALDISRSIKPLEVISRYHDPQVSTVGSLRDREVACSASDRQGSNFESCVWRTVSSQSSHHPQEVLLAQFSLYVHKGGLKPDAFYFISLPRPTTLSEWKLLIYG